MNEQLNPGQKKTIKEATKTEVRKKSSIKGDDWICKNCFNKITSDKARYYYSGSSEFNFVNPQGHQFNIITFSKADGCKSSGEAVLEHTWFPGHSWNFSSCSKCGIHLGWKYFGENSFYGLIKNRIVKALTIMN